MTSVIGKLCKAGVITPPSYVRHDTQYEVMMGSIAYGVSGEASDIDVYGFCMPYKEIVFPHSFGEIFGFGKQHQRFDQYQQHHIKVKDTDTEYDITIYNIVKYFQLCMENNPNMIDSLFVPIRCVLSTTEIGRLVRDNRKLFLHKGAWHKFKGYSYSQLHKIKTRNPEGKRKEIVEKYGYDIKHGYHVVRLLSEIEMILIDGDLDLERNREQLKAVRNGEWSLEQLEDYFAKKEASLEGMYVSSKLPHKPDEKAIKNLLLECLETFYGSFDNVANNNVSVDVLLNELKELVRKYG